MTYETELSPAGGPRPNPSARIHPSAANKTSNSRRLCPPKPLNTEHENLYSPPDSQVSVSSVAPTLVAALLDKSGASYDLTPVTRNTDSPADDVGNDLVIEANQPPVPAIAAEHEDNRNDSSSQKEMQQGLHDRLSLPMDVADSEDFTSTLPPLRVSSNFRHSQGAVPRSAQKCTAPVEMPLRPVPFPIRKRFFSFSNGEQYDEVLAEAVAAVNISADYSEGHYHARRDYRKEQSSCDDALNLRPYQPTREDAMEDLPPEEVLGQIFAARPRHSDAKIHLMPSQQMQQHLLNTSTCSNISDAPSLHMAHQVGTDTASIATHTTLNTLGEDDDLDSILFLERIGSSSKISGFSASTHSQLSSLTTRSKEEKLLQLQQSDQDDKNGCPIILDGFLPEERSTPNTFRGVGSGGDADTTMAIDGKYEREQAAIEWLQSLPSQQIAEAASSKFLCSPTNSPNRSNACLSLTPAGL